MQAGYERAGHAIYTFYSTQCHQLPQRSFFLFGPRPMYTLAEVQAAWIDTDNPAILRQFTGSPEMGWKVAWSDRMVSMYTSIFAAGLLFALAPRWLKPLPGWAVPLFILPLAIDGGTHMISDLAGIGNGFRDTNACLATLTGKALPTWFYAGDALGSFNSWLRLLTGVWLGVGVVWFVYPYFEQYLGDSAAQLALKLRRADMMT